jgi:hypothetical protein
MSNTSNLALPYLAAGQAQKHVTVNDSLRRLDAIVQLSVVSATTTAQPGSPADGAVYIVPSGKSGAQWNAYANWSLGYYRDGAWEQVTPHEGWLAYVKDTDLLLHYTGSAWDMFAPGKLLTLSATDKLLGRSSSGAGAAEEIACTAAGRALLDDVDARGQCATLGTWRVLAAGAVAASHTGNTTETVLATVNVPAGAMGLNGALRFTAHFSHTNSANAKTLNVKLGGTSGRAFATGAPTTSDGNIYQRTIQNRGAQNAQVSQQHNTGVSYGAGAPRTGTIDTSVAQDLVFTGQLTNSGETITLESYLVELFHGA